MDESMFGTAQEPRGCVSEAGLGGARWLGHECQYFCQRQDHEVTMTEVRCREWRHIDTGKPTTIRFQACAQYKTHDIISLLSQCLPALFVGFNNDL